ncbi:MAG TPA: PPC domain-containing protein [Gemmatimonadales bacterium]|nr:PPC domain-containing protein [Gemmatimonadales bacterium]
MRLRIRAPFALMVAAATVSCDRIGLGGGGSASLGNMPTLSIGEAKSGELPPADSLMRGIRGPYQMWELRGERGQRLMVEASSGAIPSLFLSVRDADGYPVATPQGFGDNSRRLRVVLPRTGSYIVVVHGGTPSARGSYTVSVAAWPAPEAPGAGSSSSLSVGETKDGLLEPGDEISGDGPYRDRWAIQLNEGARVRVEMSSGDMDAYLYVYGPDGSLVAQNDDARGLDAALSFRATRSGRYTVIASSAGIAPRSGAYRLSVSEVPAGAEPGQVLEVVEGTPVDGRLELGDSVLMGKNADVFRFTPSRTGMYQITLNSDDMDALVEVSDEFGMQVGRDDDSGGNRNARLLTQLTGGRRYRIIATNFGGMTEGSYRLLVTPMP